MSYSDTMEQYGFDPAPYRPEYDGFDEWEFDTYGEALRHAKQHGLFVCQFERGWYATRIEPRGTVLYDPDEEE